ncbi:hypothetical protein DIS24_g9064 [Lasiodiplodia hormozganensis]|uniref:RBR-type E3 ubiquitin transferase n=1 Tax=Lasiodiplodia hormozganensis TaxID=869390 RepID=A0AA39Y0P9_9PEZI|nr:hypothetical protein DIS24_g9064 [Lasiodiplodia hormozganensis]
MEVDDGSTALVLRLQLEDLASILTPADSEGNINNEAANDRAFALQLYQQELSAQRTILNDRRIASDVQAGRRIRTITTETRPARPRNHNFARAVQQRTTTSNAAVGAQPVQPVRPAEPAAEHAAERSAEPVAEPAAELATEPVTETAIEPAAEPAAEPIPEPVAEPIIEPATDLAVNSVAGLTSEAPAELATEPPAQLTSGGDGVDTVSVEDSNKSRPGLLANLITLYKLIAGLRLRLASYVAKYENTTSFTAEDATTITAGESSSAAGHDERPIRLHCVACLSDFPHFDVATLPGCRHHYCRNCLDELFRLSLTDETLFPPRCCRQPIPFDDVRDLLTGDTARDFERKRPELETTDRTYCHVPTCSTWIPPAEITDGDKVGTCPGCAARTCAACKGEAHDWGEQECLGDEATQTLLRAAGENGWQRCYNCRRFVELNTGCYHIT